MGLCNIISSYGNHHNYNSMVAKKKRFTIIKNYNIVQKAPFGENCPKDAKEILI